MSGVVLARCPNADYARQMIPERDIYTAANLMIRQFGENAARNAAKRADELSLIGDRESHRKWCRIVEAIQELQRVVPADGEKVH